MHIDSAVNYLRKHMKYASSTIVIICENAPGSRGAEMYHLARDRKDCVVMNEYGTQRQYGVQKDFTKTQSMGLKTRNLLESDGLSFATDMGTFPCANAAEYAMNVRRLKLSLIDQLTAFSIDEKGRWTGKIAGKNDDIAVSVMMTYYWSEVFIKSSNYADVRVR